jgi:Domain of unknown function (DUF6046)
MALINLIQLYQQAFGGQSFGLNTIPRVAKNGLGSLELFQFNIDKVSNLGTPIFMPCKLGGFTLPNEPLIEIEGSKNIVKTAIDGMDGTFKELYAMNDYRITIRGIAIDENNPDEYPQTIVRQIRRLCESKKSVEVSNLLCSYFDISYLSIEDFKFPALEGYQGVQPYEITCSSDKLFELEIKQ